MKAIHNFVIMLMKKSSVVANLLKVKNESNSQQTWNECVKQTRCGKSTKSKE